jgi:hypothetical protein
MPSPQVCRSRSGRAILAVAIAFSVAQPALAAAKSNYTSKTPYAPAQDMATYQRPPKGFTPVFTQHVARHGSRGLSSRKYDDLTLQIWTAAKEQGALTPLGQQLGPHAQAIMAANEALGYGNLTARGVREHQETAARLHKRLLALFQQIKVRSERIEILSSGKTRATDSGLNFAEGLIAADPGLKPLIDAPRVDADQLYFHASAANADYQAYEENDPQLLAAMKQIHDLPRTKIVARHMLEGLFSEAFVDQLAGGKLRFVDKEDGDAVVANEVEAALAIYNLLLIGPAMNDAADWRPERFIPAEDGDWLAYLTDAEDFYAKGPGFAGRDVTYRMAGVLLDDVFARIDDRIAGRGPGAVFRFAHAEEIIPLAALMQLPGSTQQAATNTLYTYQNNPWRGARVSPMAANVQWDLYRNGDRYLVRMFYNEAETPFKTDCRPVASGSLFYTVDELKRCFARPGR